MADFKRGMGRQLIKNLGQEELFINDLKPDIETGEVFFAERPGYGAFYVKGRSLFTYKNEGFSTHQKFCFFPDGLKSEYIYESQLKLLAPVKNFHLGYENIKKRAIQYAVSETEDLAALYKFAPAMNRREERYFLVDIEIAFKTADDIESGDNSKKTDRIDFLLYDNKNRQLLFCEAKRYSNEDIRGESPAVVSQLDRYNRQIAANRDNIITQYMTAFAEYNMLMGSALNPPISVYDKCGLYIFGFNRVQQTELKERLDTDGLFYGHKCRIIGNTQNDSVEKIFKALT